MEESETMAEANKAGYKGDSNTEAAAWLNAIAKGLDMSEEARFGRAQSMGFNTDDIYYHGTKYQFDRFDKSKIGMNYFESEDSGFFFTRKKQSAINYAAIHAKTDAGRVISAFLKFKNPHVISTNSEYYQPADIFDISGHDIMRDVRYDKNDAILIKGTRNDDLCVVLDPNQILSIHAAFDPETETYKNKMDLEEIMHDLLLDYKLTKGEGIEELNAIVSEYCNQENKEQDKGKEIIKQDIYKASDLDGYAPEDLWHVELLKECFNKSIEEHYEKNMKPVIKKRRKLGNR